ncbi:hypothetical protein [Bacillus sp. FSL E2-8868]|uniref:hypothetical protein n=1 Tax=Bacillus sp. FSL E2-8868 TaxID=2954598 RepID=UPI0030FACEEC
MPLKIILFTLIAVLKIKLLNWITVCWMLFVTTIVATGKLGPVGPVTPIPVAPVGP